MVNILTIMIVVTKIMAVAAVAIMVGMAVEVTVVAITEATRARAEAAVLREWTRNNGDAYPQWAGRHRTVVATAVIQVIEVAVAAILAGNKIVTMALTRENIHAIRMDVLPTHAEEPQAGKYEVVT